MNVNDLWFNTLDSFSLCRNGGNGPKHPSQLYALEKYIKFPGLSFLDYGCGSGTTIEALENSDIPQLTYMGVDIIPKNIKWCKEKFHRYAWQVNPTINRINQLDRSWDVVYSRHVVDHMDSFETALNEHCRVAKELVIIILWKALTDADEHRIEHITQDGKVYKNEYSNFYSRKLIMEAIKKQKGFELLEMTEGIGKGVLGSDTVIVMKRI